MGRLIARPLGWAVAGIALLAAIGIASARPFGYDLAAYTAAGRLLAGRPLYSLTTADGIYLGAGEFLYPPPTAVAFVPLAILPFEAARAIWSAGLLVLAGGLAYRLLRPIAPALRPWALAAYVLYLPLIAEITLGNLNNLVTLAVCLLAWHWRRRALLGGATLALAVGLKLLPIALPLFFLAAGSRRLALWAIAVGLGTIAVSLVGLGEPWRAYLALLFELASAPPAQATTLVPGLLGPLRALLPIAALAVAVLMGRLARDPTRAGTAYAVALATVPLAAPGDLVPLPRLRSPAHGRPAVSVSAVGDRGAGDRLARARGAEAP